MVCVLPGNIDLSNQYSKEGIYLCHTTCCDLVGEWPGDDMLMRGKN